MQLEMGLSYLCNSPRRRVLPEQLPTAINCLLPVAWQAEAHITIDCSY